MLQVRGFYPALLTYAVWMKLGKSLVKVALWFRGKKKKEISKRMQRG